MNRALHQWTAAWFILCLVLAHHIYLEAVAGATQPYDQTMDMLRQLFPWLPPFHFNVWMINVAGSVLALLGLTWLVLRGSPYMIAASYALATFTTADAMLHMCYHLSRAEYLASAQSSLLLLAASFFLFLTIPRRSDLHKVA
jgi:hypothetical protein